MTGVAAARSLSLRKWTAADAPGDCTRCGRWAADAPANVGPDDTASAAHIHDMCWMFFGQRFGHACDIDFIAYSALEHCNAKSIMPRGTGMNSISEILACSQQAASSGPFSDPRDSQQSFERVSARDVTWLPRGKCNRPNSARRSLDSRSRQTEAPRPKARGICQFYSFGQIIRKATKPECSHV